jgi:hypothetical protein
MRMRRSWLAYPGSQCFTIWQAQGSIASAGVLMAVAVLADALLLSPRTVVLIHSALAIVCLFYSAASYLRLPLCNLDYQATLYGRQIIVDFAVGRMLTLGFFFIKYAVRAWHRPGAFVLLTRPLFRSDKSLALQTVNTRRWHTLANFAEVLGPEALDAGTLRGGLEGLTNSSLRGGRGPGPEGATRAAQEPPDPQDLGLTGPRGFRQEGKASD